MSRRREPTSPPQLLKYSGFWRVSGLAACLEKHCKSSWYLQLCPRVLLPLPGTVPASPYPSNSQLRLNGDVGPVALMELQWAGMMLSKKQHWFHIPFSFHTLLFIPSKVIAPSVGEEQSVRCSLSVRSYTGPSPSGGARETRVAGPQPPWPRLFG